jgi:hypothetical protein
MPKRFPLSGTYGRMQQDQAAFTPADGEPTKLNREPNAEAVSGNLAGYVRGSRGAQPEIPGGDTPAGSARVGLEPSTADLTARQATTLTDVSTTQSQKGRMPAGPLRYMKRPDASA